MQLQLYDQPVPVTRAADVSDPQWTVIEPRLDSLNGLDGQLHQPAILALRDTFHLIRRGTVFVATQFRGLRMTRSFVDTSEGHFYWHATDLAADGYSSAERVMSYLLHDAHHCRQFMNGDKAQDLDSLVRREVDATDVQLIFARTASAADRGFITFLENYRDDPDAIKARLKTGVGFVESMLFAKPRYQSHLAIF